MENKIETQNETIKEDMMDSWYITLTNDITGEVKYTGTKAKNFAQRWEDKKAQERGKLERLNENGLIEFKGTSEDRYVAVYINAERKNPFGKDALSRGYLDILREHLCQYTNAIVVEKTSKTGIPKPMSKQEMMECIGAGKSKFYDFLKKAKSLGVLCEHIYDVEDTKRSVIMMNPAYAHQSVRLSHEVIFAFIGNKAFKSVLTESHLEQIERLKTDKKYIK